MLERSEQQIETLYREHKDHVYNYIARMTNDKQQALDITQEAFIKLMQTPDLSTIRHSKAYLFTVARNLLFDAWKKKTEIPISDDMQQRHQQQTDPASQPFDIARNKAEQKHVGEAIQKIKPNYRELLILHYIEGLSYQEIVAITGKELSSVKVNLHRARHAFDDIFTTHMYAKVAASRQHCDELTRLLAPFGIDEIPTEEMPLIEQHLNNCAICMEDAEHLKQRRELFASLPMLYAPDFLEKLNPTGSAGSTATATTQATSSTLSVTASGVSLLKTVAIVATISTVVISGLAAVYLINADKNDQELITAVPDMTVADSETTPTPSSSAGAGAEKPATKPQPTPNNTPAASPVQSAKNVPVDPGAWWYYSGEPFSAKIIQQEQGETSRSDFLISEHGVRHEGSDGPTGNFIFITNFKNKKGWVLDPARRIYVDAKLNKKGYSQLFPDSEEHMDNLLNKIPCKGFDLSRSLGNDVIGSRKVEKWQCGLTRTQQETTQWFDKKLGLVIAEKNDTIGYHSLQSVTPSKVDEALFYVPKTYKEVEADEFFPGFGF